MKMTGPILLMLTLWLSGCAEYVPFSSGALIGNSVPVPAHWTDITLPKIIQLETKPEKPYSVKLWIVKLGAALYVHAGTNRAAWVANIETNPRVKLLVGETLYKLSAERVTTQAEFNAFSEVYETKYGRRPGNEIVDEAYLFRLTGKHAGQL